MEEREEAKGCSTGGLKSTLNMLLDALAFEKVRTSNLRSSLCL